MNDLGLLAAMIVGFAWLMIKLDKIEYLLKPKPPMCEKEPSDGEG